MSIKYDHSQNLHTLAGPKAAIAELFSDEVPASVLDVGCGTGTWLRALKDRGVEDCLGIDGVAVSADRLLIPFESFEVRDLTRSWSIDRAFDLVLCLEVAEHLEEASAPLLVKSLTQHADRILFSAAAPGQPGQHHVNCQRPAYWQSLFNQLGYACYDEIRWRIWDNPKIEPWYRQNMFEARKHPEHAGKERRIPFVIHPDMLDHGIASGLVVRELRMIESGAMPLNWYLKTPLKAIISKCLRLATRIAPSSSRGRL